MITDDNPTGAATFDHRPIANLPEYQALADAKAALVAAMRRAEVEITHAEWLRIDAEMARALAFSDNCPSDDDPDATHQAQCYRNGWAAVAGRVEGSWIFTEHHCDRHGAWSSGYSLDSPLLDL